jgi:hypothetical protein
MINFAQRVLFIYVMYIVRNYVTLLLLYADESNENLTKI